MSYRTTQWLIQAIHKMSRRTFPSVYIIVLNWNGWRDTIECLESLQKSDYPNFRLVLIDNGSSDKSLEKIQAWAGRERHPVNVADASSRKTDDTCVIYYESDIAKVGGIPEIEEEIDNLLPSEIIILISSKENLGFASGNNLGIRYALRCSADYIWLLNNDTVVDPQAISRFVEFLTTNPGFQGATAQIRLYSKPDQIWNCGGQLTWYGTRKYFYAEAPCSAAPRTGYEKVSFVTGCALFLSCAMIRNAGLLSERFFFGEEDFEFSYRLKRKGIPLACLHDAIVYHKVNASINTATKSQLISKIYLHYLNRFIDLRYFWPRSIWLIWRFFYSFYIFPMIYLRHRIPFRNLWKMAVSLFKNSAQLEQVDKLTFETILAAKFE